MIELGQLLAGPFTSSRLADFGAEVIKCEQPGSGDPLRVWGQEKPYGKSLWWPVVGRNKKSLTINLRTAEGHGYAYMIDDTGSTGLIDILQPVQPELQQAFDTRGLEDEALELTR